MRAGRLRSVVGYPVLAALVALIAYANALPGGFHFDDVGSVVENQEIRRLTPALLVSAYRPLVKLSLAINYAFAELEPATYVATNIALHALNCALLALLAAAVARRFDPERRELARRAGLIAGVGFAVHPLATESVNVVIERSELLAALGVLWGLRQHLHADRRRHLAWLGFLVGLAAKEQAAIFPALIVLLEWGLTPRGARPDYRRILGRSLPYTALLLAGIALIYGQGIRGYQWPYPWARYAIAELEALGRYVRLSLWPINLNLDHDLRLPSLLAPGVVAGALLLLAAIALVARLGPGMPALGVSWFLVSLAPTALVPLRDVLAEHRCYLPLAGALLAAGVGAAGLDRARSVAGIAIALAAGLLLTWNRNRDYRSEIALWSDTARKSPAKARPHSNLGARLLDAGDLTGAIDQFELALRLNPMFHDAWLNLSVALTGSGNSNRAAEVLEQAIAKFPRSGKLHTNLGVIRLQQGRRDEARRLFERALEGRGSDVRASNNLARMALEDGRLEDARRHIERARRGNPNLPAVYLNRATLARLERDFATARSSLDRARALAPGLAEVPLEEGHLALARGDWSGALERYQTALQLQPDLVPALRGIARACFGLGRDAEAAEALARARELSRRERAQSAVAIPRPTRAS
jgi:Flp pilus assembly protein TadD